MNEEDSQKYWFVARTRDKQEFSIRDALKKINIEYFLPTQIVVRQLKYRKKTVEVPILKNLIFIHAPKQEACDVHNKYFVPLFYMRDLRTRAMLIIPDKQMQDFISVMDLDPAGVSFDDEKLLIGNKVRVVKGIFRGIEGELAAQSGQTYVALRIEGVLTATIKVPRSYLKAITHASHNSQTNNDR